MNNCGKFRAVRDISVAPMDASDQAAILKMMDEEDGVVNRRVRKNKAATVTVFHKNNPTVRFDNSIEDSVEEIDV